MCVYIYICLYVYIYVYTCICLGTCVYVRMYMHMYMYIISINHSAANVITFARFCLKQMWWLTKAIAEMKCEHWTKTWNWSSCPKEALSARWTHGLIVQSVRASERNSVVAGLNPMPILITTIALLWYADSTRPMAEFMHCYALFIQQSAQQALGKEHKHIN